MADLVSSSLLGLATLPESLPTWLGMPSLKGVGSDSSNFALAYSLVLSDLNIQNHNCLLSFSAGAGLTTLVPRQVG